MPTKANTMALITSAAENRAKVGDEKQAEQQAENRCEKPGSPAADSRPDQNRRHEKQIGGLAGKDRFQTVTQNCRHCDGQQRNAVRHQRRARSAKAAIAA